MLTFDSLIEVIESLQDAIRQDGRTIEANETRTRNTLIDPLLKALGWADPSVLTQEYLVRYGRRDYEYGVVDYAFHPPTDRANPIAFLEAKRMNEDLTDEHRNQVFTYVLDKGGSVRQFGLTNGDRWELYELNEGEPRKIFEFSIHKQSASDCADLLFSHFPMLNRPSAARSLKSAEALPRVVHNAGIMSGVPEIHVLPSRRLTNHVDVPKALTWLGVSLIVFGILGWVSGVWKAQPIEGFFEYVGLFIVAVGMILAVVLVRRFFPSTVPVVLRILRLKWLFAPINGNRRKNADLGRVGHSLWYRSRRCRGALDRLANGASRRECVRNLRQGRCCNCNSSHSFINSLGDGTEFRQETAGRLEAAVFLSKAALVRGNIWGVFTSSLNRTYFPFSPTIPMPREESRTCSLHVSPCVIPSPLGNDIWAMLLRNMAHISIKQGGWVSTD